VSRKRKENDFCMIIIAFDYPLLSQMLDYAFVLTNASENNHVKGILADGMYYSNNSNEFDVYNDPKEVSSKSAVTAIH
jgi:hypothetical protein